MNFARHFTLILPMVATRFPFKKGTSIKYSGTPTAPLGIYSPSLFDISLGSQIRKKVIHLILPFIVGILTLGCSVKPSTVYTPIQRDKNDGRVEFDINSATKKFLVYMYTDQCECKGKELITYSVDPGDIQPYKYVYVPHQKYITINIWFFGNNEEVHRYFSIPFKDGDVLIKTTTDEKGMYNSFYRRDSTSTPWVLIPSNEIIRRVNRYYTGGCEPNSVVCN